MYFQCLFLLEKEIHNKTIKCTFSLFNPQALGFMRLKTTYFCCPS